MGKISAALRHISLMLIRGYRIFLSPWMGWRCRFYPTCSQFALESIEQHGFLKGSWLTCCRLGRCHPWAQGGLDPVPQSTKGSETL